MGEKKVKTADVARATGLNRSTVTALYQETAQRVDLEVIERLCVYFDCGVADLLEFVPDPES